MKQASEVLDSVVSQRIKWLQQAHETRIKLDPHLKAITTIAHAVGAKLEHDYGERINVVLQTSDLKGAALRLMEALTEATGVEFTTSTDTAEDWGASRAFRGSNIPISVVVELPLDNQDGCRRVQVGVKEVPVYELQCDDGSQE